MTAKGICQVLRCHHLGFSPEGTCETVTPLGISGELMASLCHSGSPSFPCWGLSPCRTVDSGGSVLAEPAHPSSAGAPDTLLTSRDLVIWRSLKAAFLESLE